MTTTTPISASLVILGQISTTMRPLRTKLTLIGSLPLARTPSISRTTPNEAGLLVVVSPRRAVGGRRLGHRDEVPQRRIALLDHMLATDLAALYFVQREGENNRFTGSTFCPTIALYPPYDGMT
jgi:hypothetical protein